jgi:hypothetical protein
MDMRQKSDNGQVSIDFVIGIMIFIVAFLFLFAAIPSMFTPFQSNSDRLTMTADKVAANLVDNVLANKSNDVPLPGIIDYNKFDNLNTQLNDDDYKKSIGLGNEYGVYNIQVILQEYHTTTDSFTNFTVPLSSNQPGNQNIGQSRRYVQVRYLNRTGTTDYFPGLNAIMVVRVW